jgi:hypothetical protein
MVALAVAISGVALAASPATASPTGDVTQGPCTYWTAPMYLTSGHKITANVYVRCTRRATLNDVVEVIKQDISWGADPEIGRNHRYDVVAEAGRTYNLGSIASGWCRGGVFYARVAMKVNGTWGAWYEGTHYRCPA